MSKKRKPLPVCETGSGEGKQTLLPGIRFSRKNFITDFKPAQGSIAALLLYGRNHALTTSELSRITGKNHRELTREICAERRAGAPILSDPGAGFWLAESIDELQRCAAALHRRAGEIHRTAQALEQLAERMPDS